MKTNRGLAPIVWVIIAALLLSGGYALYKIHAQYPEERKYDYVTGELVGSAADTFKKRLNAEFSDLAVSTVPDTKGWNVYHNKEFGFEVSFPREWKIIPIYDDSEFGRTLLKVVPQSDSSECLPNWGDLYSCEKLGEVFEVRTLGALESPDGKDTGWRLGKMYKAPVWERFVNKNNLMLIMVAPKESLEAIDEKILSTFTFSQTDRQTYRNETYGFAVALPESWRGYTVTETKKDIWDVSGTGQSKVIGQFPLIEIVHPLSTAEHPRQTIPIDVFTKEQWSHIGSESAPELWSVSAAPLPPSKLGENSRYVFALPARYNFANLPGWEEVQKIIDSRPLSTFEPNDSAFTH